MSFVFLIYHTETATLFVKSISIFNGVSFGKQVVRLMKSHGASVRVFLCPNAEN